MARHWLKNRHACPVHTQDVLKLLEPLVPLTDETDTQVQPAELLDWIVVETEDEPVIAEHGWRVDLGDEVGLLVHPEREDIANSLGTQVGVLSVVQVDREVLVVDAPSLCADGLRAAVMQAIAAANENAHNSAATAHVGVTVRDPSQGTQADSSTEGHAPTTPGPSADDDHAARLVTGDALWAGHRIQIWVNQEGVLFLPAQTITHGPLDPSDNPRFQRATFNSTHAVGLAEQHAGRWIPYASLAKLQLRRPGPVRRRWAATIDERGGDAVSFHWRGTRPHAMLLWVYAVAQCGLDRVEGSP